MSVESSVPGSSEPNGRRGSTDGDEARGSSHPTRGGPPADPGGRWAVVAGATALVLAVWGSLHLAQSRSTDGKGVAAEPAASALSPDIEGFRADALHLPDDSLLGFVEIPAGPFVMGSDPGVDSLAFDIEWWGDGRVQGTVDLPRYYLARFETTVAQYAAFVRATGHPLPDLRTLQAPPDHPVAFVAWPDAVEYARWLDETLRGLPATPGPLRALLEDGWRVTLPTEAQWEKAARGSDARIYPWGDEPDRRRANYRALSTAPVGSFGCPDCTYGLADMAGNVWEWTRSPYQPYPYDEADDHAGLSSDALWVMRGGSFGDPERFVRGANRGGADPGARRPFIGFRVALTR